jgi:acetoin utilization deacetylase AcuC-like enzyme/GNAT superfamily N-acetyltransferase
MFRVRRIIDDVLPMDRAALAQVQEILRAQFPDAPESDFTGLPARLRDPLSHRFRTLLYVADDGRGEVRGFALVSHDPESRFLFLDYLASGRRLTGRGIGGALYARVREEARTLGAVGVFCECAPDLRAECADEAEFRANVARLRFYERYGARPLDGNDYHRPIRPGDRGMPFLLFDPLGGVSELRRATARRVVRTILERKYARLCPPAYVDAVVASFRGDPIRTRPPRYVRTPPVEPAVTRPPDETIPLVVNDRHDIHHVRERGYVEAPVRIGAIRSELDASGLFRPMPPRAWPERHILAVHDRGLVDYLRRCCANAPDGKSVYPYVFPIRNASRPPRELTVRAGYYCIDTFTPIHRNAYVAARRAVDCALTAAESLLRGQRLAYALVRPPGHHAERRVFGGFCYFNSTAVAAHFLSQRGRVAVLDIDYHHGNGQQDIFYGRADVLTVSIHGHPSFAYPYFSGFPEECGEGPGEGFNVNHPLPERVDGGRYRKALRRALARVRSFEPTLLVVALGLDTAKGDPTGTWTLGAADFEENGRLIGELRLPTLVVQEGGYRTQTLGVNARRFFVGLHDGIFGQPRRRPPSGGD